MCLCVGGFRVCVSEVAEVAGNELTNLYKANRQTEHFATCPGEQPTTVQSLVRLHGHGR